MNESIDIVRHPKQIVTMKISQPLEKFDMMRIKKDWQISLLVVKWYAS